METAFFIALGGALGALSRYKVSGVAHRLLGSSFPWGTLSVNLIGCFIIGFLWGASEELIIPPNFRSFALIGFVGSFTTFSTFSLETFNLIRDGEMKLALLNVTVSNIVGVALVVAGMLTSRYLFKLLRR